MGSEMCIRDRDHVHLVADGAGLMPDGTFGGRVLKLFPFPHLNMVVGCRGEVSFGMMVAIALCGAGSTFDEVKANAPRALRQVSLLPAVKGVIEVYVGGWSESTGPNAWMIVTRAIQQAPDIEPFKVTDLGSVTVMPAPNPVAPDLLEALHGPRPLDHLAELVDAVRRTPVPIAYVPNGFGETIDAHVVGGFVQIATVARDEIRTACLHRWPDEIGKPIDPGERDRAA